MVHGSRSKPLWDFWVQLVALLCCCKRTDPAAQIRCLAPRAAEMQTGVPLQMEYLGLENGKGQLQRNKKVIVVYTFKTIKWHECSSNSLT